MQSLNKVKITATASKSTVPWWIFYFVLCTRPFARRNKGTLLG
ncbi:hypothetical protein [Campylobacter troglodytis]|nr:hypothetical protein [Campylobacter troglodytis]